MDNIKGFINSKGCAFEVLESDLDGKFHEFNHGGQKGWFVGSRENDFVTFTFGDWRDPDEQHTYIDSKSPITPEQQQSLKQKSDDKKEKQNQLTKTFVSKIFRKLENKTSEPPNDYFIRKKLIPTNIFFKAGDGGNQSIAMIPMSDTFGEVWNVQYIGSDGTKNFQPGGRIKGLFHAIGYRVGDETTEHEKIYVGEGYATCMSFHLATGKPILVAFSASNIKYVCEALLDAQICTGSQIIVVADWDGGSAPHVGNTGMIEAQKIWEKWGIPCVTPMTEGALSQDYSDLWVKDLGDYIKDTSEHYFEGDQFESWDFVGSKKLAVAAMKAEKKVKAEEETAEPKTEAFIAPNLCPLHVTQFNVQAVIARLIPTNKVTWSPAKPNIPSRPSCPTEGMVVEELIRCYGDDFCVSEGCLFEWVGTHWAEVSDTHKLYADIYQCCGGLAGNSKIEQIIRMFKAAVVRTPKNLFIQNPYVVTFKNGTLRADKDSKGSWHLTFGNHNKKDYSTALIPIDFDTSVSIKNTRFEETVNNLVGASGERIRALKQMYGACLMPIYPRLFMCLGKPGRGKSTAIILASKLVSEENVSRVSPNLFENFMVEAMLGKLINIDTDIPVDEKIPDHFMKKIEDRQPFAVNRKGRKVVNATIPAVHIFGANDLPPTRERSMGAYDRRWSFNIFDQWNVGSDEHNKDIVEEIVGNGLQGIVNFAIEGLRDVLHCKGKYFQSLEMKRALKDWQKSNDFIQQFLDGLCDGSFVPRGQSVGNEIERTKMWEWFGEFHKNNYPDGRVKLGKIKFFDILEKQKSLAARKNGSGNWKFDFKTWKSSTLP